MTDNGRPFRRPVGQVYGLTVNGELIHHQPVVVLRVVKVDDLELLTNGLVTFLIGDLHPFG